MRRDVSSVLREGVRRKLVPSHCFLEVSHPPVTESSLRSPGPVRVGRPELRPTAAPSTSAECRRPPDIHARASGTVASAAPVTHSPRTPRGPSGGHAAGPGAEPGGESGHEARAGTARSRHSSSLVQTRRTGSVLRAPRGPSVPSSGGSSGGRVPQLRPPPGDPWGRHRSPNPAGLCSRPLLRGQRETLAPVLSSGASPQGHPGGKRAIQHVYHRQRHESPRGPPPPPPREESGEKHFQGLSSSVPPYSQNYDKD